MWMEGCVRYYSDTKLRAILGLSMPDLVVEGCACWYHSECDEVVCIITVTD